MGDFRLEDLWAIIQGLAIVGVLLFVGMATIALWSKVGMLIRAAWRRYIIFSWDELMEWMADQHEEDVNNYQEDAPAAPVVMSRSDDEPSRTNERTERTNERSLHDLLWGDFLLDKTRERLIAVMVEEDFTVSEIRGLLKGESTVIGQEIEAARQRLGKAPSQPYTTPIAQRPTAAQFETDPDLAYHPPPR